MLHSGSIVGNPNAGAKEMKVNTEDGREPADFEFTGEF
jgi:hypothetical protein